MTRAVRTLPLHGSREPMSYFHPRQELPERLEFDSPAILSMTDFRQVSALTCEPGASIEWALLRMKEAGVRLLLVTDTRDAVLGLITTTDILGERPVKLQQELQVRFSDILVQDVMTPWQRLEFLAMADVMRATVADIVLTLKRVGRKHALVIDENPCDGHTAIRGVFSATQLARQLGEPVDPLPVASTFAEMKAVLSD